MSSFLLLKKFLKKPTTENVVVPILKNFNLENYDDYKCRLCIAEKEILIFKEADDRKCRLYTGCLLSF